MSTHPPPNFPCDTAPPATLGDLLYRDRSKRRIPESAWVAQVRAIANQDAKALRTLFDIAHPMVLSLAQRITQNRETAEEVTLEVFYEIWLRAPDFDPSGGPVISWIMNMARSRALERGHRDPGKKSQPDHVEARPAAANGAGQHMVGEDSP
jgi:DNA-directed RNA polymerase specialized sigma24 family protein